MPSNGSSNHLPFWEDEPYSYSVIPPQAVRSLGWLLNLVSTVLLLPVLFVPAIIFAAIGPLWAWAWIVFIAILVLRAFYQQRRTKLRVRRITQIQEQARSVTAATSIGSAIHVAGHPLLARDQPVVLALIGKQLSIFAYESPMPLDTLPIKELHSVKTVVYDDDHIPHIEVVDSAAQALQLTFIRNGQSWACLFRQMRKVRPIDWYT